MNTQRLESSFWQAVLVIGAVALGAILWLSNADKEEHDRKVWLEQQKRAVELYTKQQAIIQAQKERDVVVAFIQRVNPALSEGDAKKIYLLKKKYSEEYGVPLIVGLAVAWQESHFKQKAKSRTGPVGMMQIAVSHWKKECSGNLKSLDNNLRCGYYVLAKHRKGGKRAWGSVFERYYGGTNHENTTYRLTVMKKVVMLQNMMNT